MPLCNLFPGSLADLQQSPRRVSDSLNGSNHLLNEAEVSATLEVCHLRALHDVLDINAHFVHRAGDFVDGGSRLDAHLRGFGRRRCHLTGSDATPVALSLTFMARSRSPRIICRNALAIVSCDDLGRTVTFNRPSANCRGHAGHFLQVKHHVAVMVRQGANLIVL